MESVKRTKLSNDTSSAYAGHYGAPTRNPTLQSVVGKDGPTIGRPSQPNIHSNFKIGPYSRSDPRRIYRYKRFSHMFVNTLNNININPSTATTMFPLEELNYYLHDWQLKKEERAAKPMKGLTDPYGKTIADPEIDTDFVRRFITYMGVLNTEDNAVPKSNKQKTVSIIHQGSTSIPNSFGDVNVFTAWSLFFIVKDKCISTPQRYCFDEVLGDKILKVPQSGKIARIEYVALRDERSIPIYCKCCGQGNPYENRSVAPDCKHTILAYDEEMDSKGTNKAAYDNLLKEKQEKFIADGKKLLNLTVADATAFDTKSRNEQKTIIEDAFSNLKYPMKLYTRKIGHAIPIGYCEFNDYRTGNVLVNCEVDVKNYQLNKPLKVWMRATNQ